MAAFDFPTSPAIGQAYGNYIWDGEKWTLPNLVDAVAARKSVYAAPFDAMAYSGMQINGSMEVSQERAGVASALMNDQYICDGWSFAASAAGATFVSQVALANWVPGIPNLLTVSVTAGKPALAAGDVAAVVQHIEGYRVARLAWGTANARPITIAFWCAHARVGTYSVAIRNFDSTRSYVTTYTQNAANLSEYKVLTIPGCTDGVWKQDNTRGISVVFTMAAGTAAIAPSANTWLSGLYYAAAGQVNGIAAATDVLRITGVVVLPGIEAPSAERSPLIMRPYADELLACKRYFYNGVPPARGVATAANTVGRMGCPHPATMRANPTLTITANLPIFDGSSATVISALISYSGVSVLEFDGSGATALTLGRAVSVYQSSGGNLNVDARL